MGRLTGDNIEQFRDYSNSGSGKRRNYLTLKDKGDSVKGRILCENVDDIECYVVHRVKVGDWEREVNCLYEDGGSIEDCPLCMAKIPRSAKIFIPFYDKADNVIKMFERPNSFYSKVSGYCARYAPIVNYEVELVRNHEKDSKKPDYDIFPSRNPDDTTIDDILDDLGLDEMPKILGSYVLEKTADEMDAFVRDGEFSDNTDVPVRRSRSERQDEDTPRRRSRGDRF